MRSGDKKNTDALSEASALPEPSPTGYEYCFLIESLRNDESSETMARDVLHFVLDDRNSRTEEFGRWCVVELILPNPRRGYVEDFEFLIRFCGYGGVVGAGMGSSYLNVTVAEQFGFTLRRREEEAAARRMLGEEVEVEERIDKGKQVVRREIPGSGKLKPAIIPKREDPSVNEDTGQGHNEWDDPSVGSGRHIQSGVDDTSIFSGERKGISSSRSGFGGMDIRTPGSGNGNIHDTGEAFISSAGSHTERKDGASKEVSQAIDLYRSRVINSRDHSVSSRTRNEPSDKSLESWIPLGTPPDTKTAIAKAPSQPTDSDITPRAINTWDSFVTTRTRNGSNNRNQDLEALERVGITDADSFAIEEDGQNTRAALVRKELEYRKAPSATSDTLHPGLGGGIEENHKITPTLLVNVYKYACTLQAQGELSRAVWLFTAVWFSREIVLGPDHIATLISMVTLAEVYRELGQDEKGSLLFQGLEGALKQESINETLA
ncbi:hypothetical protein RUND412_003699 [Rhizina undulata]